MKKLHWLIIAIVLILAIGFAAVYQTRIKHYILPQGSAPERPTDTGPER
ncbi:MAG TPA: hypothetical protein VJK50_01665 [Patescibacteria group bacterium]|nr:hypothetical protein [Patescibacteria group bacterium]